MAGVLAENYQLKWHSHSNHLHSSVATLYRSDNFTDVTLVTGDGRYLSAHRFVLSACSSYLNRILHIGGSFGAGNGLNPNMVIILPPEISYRTLVILLQYMYSGEATVSNEQLNGVLKAGEVLRIKGLCHSKETSDERKRMHHASSAESCSTSGHGKHDPLSIDTGDSNTLYMSTSGLVANKSNHDVVSSSAGSSRGSVNKPSSDKTENLPKKLLIKASSLKSKTSMQSEQVSTNITIGKRAEISKGDVSDIVVEDDMKVENLVKEEPIDWDDIEEDASIVSQEESIEPEVNVKTERPSSGDSLYAPLTCDMCQETFNTPALWVRHIENHPATEMPRKKRKKGQGGEDEEDDEEEYPLLRCELCQKVFTSPADWVRHIQSKHTEEQLALSNSARHSKRNPRVACDQCKKTFPSIASMLIHSRTHTGEKPYVCCVCEKGFNVKSNLLRHLRTLHDHLLHPPNSANQPTKPS